MMRSLAYPTGPVCPVCDGTGLVPHPWPSPFRRAPRRHRICAQCSALGHEATPTTPARRLERDATR
jgi:hypothetical protein